MLIACGVALLQTVAFAADPIKIGFWHCALRPLAGGGKSGLSPIRCGAEEVNARGGILGRPRIFIHYDDQSNPATVPALFTPLLDFDKVDLVVSPYATNHSRWVAMPVIIPRGMLLLSAARDGGETTIINTIATSSSIPTGWTRRTPTRLIFQRRRE